MICQPSLIMRKSIRSLLRNESMRMVYFNHGDKFLGESL